MSRETNRPAPVPGPTHPGRPVSTRLTGRLRIAGLVAVLLVALGLVATGGAGPAVASSWKGKTKGGTAITFRLAGSRLRNVRTMIPTICLETTGGYTSKAGAELFRPPKAVLGRKVKSKALQPAAMNYGNKATKSYTVLTRRAGGKITGRLSLSFSFLIPDLYGAKIFICSGSSTFTAKPR